ncbi:MAG: KTSC domain-containing protein [Pedobacter sp.]|nr:KTSC domain-containing protein [Pedobacter sp.]MDQ8053302.1 KTSC domain-containing protein [Pedobacter sp.]
MPSTVIDHYEYDEVSKNLLITFVTGMVYCYKDVPIPIYKLFKGSISKGRYFNYHIKDKFQFEKLND